LSLHDALPISRLPLIAALGVLVAVVAAGGVYLVVRGGSTATTVQPNSVGIIDPASNKIVGEIPVGARPSQVVAAAGGIWVANLEDRTVIRLDPTTKRLVRTISTEDAPIALTASDRFIWAVSASFTLPYATIVRRIDPRVNYCPLDLALDILRRGLSSSSWRFTCVGVVNTASVGFASLRGWRNVGQLTTGRCRRGSCRRRSGPDD